MPGTMGSSARLVVLDPPPLRGRSADVADAVVVLGRDPRSVLVLDDPHVSRRHAVLRRTSGGYVIEDDHSTSGTLVNRRPLTGPTPIRDGDLITLAGITLRYEEPGPRLGETRTMDAVAPAAARYDIGEQEAHLLNNVGGSQYNDYRQHIITQVRDTFLRDVAASKSRARGLMWVGFLLSVAGVGTYMAIVLRFINSIDRGITSASTASDGQIPGFAPTELLGPEIGGIPLAGIAIFVTLIGGVLLIVGLVQLVTAAARARRVDQVHPLPSPYPTS